MKHLALAAAVLTACTHHRKLTNPSELAGEEVTVELTSAPFQEIDGTVVPDRDGHVVVRTVTDGDIPFGAISRVTEKSHAIGALEGLGLGAAIGAAGGALIGIASGDDVCNTDRSIGCPIMFTRWEKAALGGFLLGALTGLIGLAVGTMRGSRFVYEF